MHIIRVACEFQGEFDWEGSAVAAIDDGPLEEKHTKGLKVFADTAPGSMSQARWSGPIWAKGQPRPVATNAVAQEAEDVD